jgi:hypothetical protein
MKMRPGDHRAALMVFVKELFSPFRVEDPWIVSNYPMRMEKEVLRDDF